MSSLQDPFDLLKTRNAGGQEMENIVPFLAQPYIDKMIENALKYQQVPAKRFVSNTVWKFGGVAIAACLALFMVFLTPESQPVTQNMEQVAISNSSTEDVGEFGELVMLDTLESY